MKLNNKSYTKCTSQNKYHEIWLRDVCHMKQENHWWKCLLMKTGICIKSAWIPSFLTTETKFDTYSYQIFCLFKRKMFAGQRKTFISGKLCVIEKSSIYIQLKQVATIIIEEIHLIFSSKILINVLFFYKTIF